MSDHFGSFTMSRRNRRNMIFGVVISALVVLISLLYFTKAQKSENTLQLVHMIFRHGDRTPTETYKSDPHKDYNWPGGWGALTLKGKKQLYKMGRVLHDRYKTYIHYNFSINQISVRTSDSDRCFMSAGTLLAGMFPPLEEDIWEHDLLWQPIPIRSSPRDKDNLIAMKQKCNVYDDDLKQAYNSEEIQKLNEEYAEMFHYLSDKTGQAMFNITAVEFLFNTLQIENENNLALPSWIYKYYPNEMKYIAARSLSIFTETQRMRRLKGGVILKEIIKHIEDKQVKKLNKFFFLYSGHDISLTNIIRTLGFIEDMKPEYGATLIFETHSYSNLDLEMKLLYYNNTYTETPHILKIKNCGEPCLLRNFVKVLSDVIPENWEEECKN